MDPFAVLVIGAAITLPLFLMVWAFAFAVGRRSAGLGRRYIGGR